MTNSDKRRNGILEAMGAACQHIDELKKLGGYALAIENTRGMVKDCARQLRYYIPGTPEHDGELQEALDIARDVASPCKWVDADSFTVEHFHVARMARCYKYAPTLRDSGEWLLEVAKAGLVRLVTGGTLCGEYVMLASPVYPGMTARYQRNEELRASGSPGAVFMGG